MVRFTTTILKFDRQGEKTGWTYITIPGKIAKILKPGNKKTFRVKGKLDSFGFEGVALLPMGEGNFILALNATMRKGIKKQKGAIIEVQLEVDNKAIAPPAELIECLNDEPDAAAFFNTIAKSHQHYFIKWIESAKTDETKARRIAHTVDALSRKYDFGTMLRSLKNKKDLLM